MPVDFATFFAHQTGPDYSRFMGQVRLGRPHRQPLLSATDGADVVDGLELYLGNNDELATVYAWLSGDISWTPAAGNAPSRLTLTTNPVNYRVWHRTLDPGVPRTNLKNVPMIEAPPGAAVYENVNPEGLRAHLQATLLDAYNHAVANPQPPSAWHPVLQGVQVLQQGQAPQALFAYLATDTAARIAQVVRAFLGEATGGLQLQGGALKVRAGDRLGWADTYPSPTPVPAAEARRITFKTQDRCKQSINPIYYLHYFMRQMLLANNARAVNSLTHVVTNGRVTHPLAGLFPALNTSTAASGAVTRAGNVVTVSVTGHGLRVTQKVRLSTAGNASFPTGLKTVFEVANTFFRYREAGQDATSAQALTFEPMPLAREYYNGQSRFPLGDLQTYHRYQPPPPPPPNPPAQPAPHYEWRYTDQGLFEARVIATQVAVRGLQADANRRARLRNLWTAHGAEIARIADLLQVPVEALFGVLGAEARLLNAQNVDPRSLAIEPLTPGDRDNLRRSTAAQHELQYDRLVGEPGTATQVRRLADGTTELQVTLGAARTWGLNVLNRNHRRLLVADAETLKITQNSSAPRNPADPTRLVATRNYTITVEDRQFKGSFVMPPPRRPGGETQGPGQTLYHPPLGANLGQAAAAGLALQLNRTGTLRHLQVTAVANNLTVPTTVAVTRLLPNGGEQDLISVQLGAGMTRANEMNQEAAVAQGDNLVVRVTTGNAAPGAAGVIRGLAWSFRSAPTDGAAWVLDGHYDVTVPQPWPGAAQVRPQTSTLTWEELADVTDVTRGNNLTPGLMQTKPGTADTINQWLRERLPGEYPPVPQTPGDYLRSYLLDAVNAIWLGAAYIRMGYNRGASRFDLPLVGTAFNSSILSGPGPNLRLDNASPWGLKFFARYVEGAAPQGNAAAILFNEAETPPTPPPQEPPLTPPPLVRFMR